MKKILVVDDERHIVRLIQVNLERQGYNVVTAHDGKEALEKVASEKPDLVVLDVMMPYMDGFEVLRTLRRNPETAELPGDYADREGTRPRCVSRLARGRRYVPDQAVQPTGADHLRQAHLPFARVWRRW
jgi:CheY-like chemotaxis protein